jgi:hypothetical protein
MQRLERTIQLLNKNNESLVASNSMLLQDNTLFHYKNEQINKLIDMMDRKTNELRVKASMICNNVSKYELYLSEVLAFIRNIANIEVAFKNE